MNLKPTAYLICLCATCAMTINANAQHTKTAASTPIAQEELTVHDPAMATQGDTLYMFCTGNGISQMHSTDDGRTWVADGPCLSELPQWVKKEIPEAGMHIWAPDITWADGRWHLFYCCSLFGKNKSVIGHATSKSLNRNSKEYGWKDEGMVIYSVPGRDNWNAIDPALATDDNGDKWMSFGSFWGGIMQVKLDEQMKAPSHPEQWYRLATRPRADSKDNAIEAPFVFKHDSMYYLFVSFDYCCRGKESTYKVVVGRSKSINGPYLNREGNMMAHGAGTEVFSGDGNKYVAGGHCCVTTLRNGQDVMAIHAYRSEDGAPKLLMMPIRWTEDGWPEVTTKK